MVKELTKISLNECLRKYDVKFDNTETYIANEITISKEQIRVINGVRVFIRGTALIDQRI